ncbi:MAG: hypothetical protein ACOC0Q_06865, partial [Wenzhouxiangella sp.]
HPFAATGARILATLTAILEQAGSGRGLISVCTAGGMGVAAIVERPAAGGVPSRRADRPAGSAEDDGQAAPATKKAKKKADGKKRTIRKKKAAPKPDEPAG